MAFFDFIRQTKEQIRELFAVHFSSEARSERLQRAYHLSSTREWVDPNGYRLSDRVWIQRGQVRAQIDKLLREAIARGDDALTVADKLEQYLVPGQRPIRGVAGDLLRGQPKRIVTSTPGRGGSGSYSARRLARTEISRAHAAAAEWSAARTPFIQGLRYSLSAAHPEPDRCDDLASADNGLGPGVYRLGDVPTVPQHPNCLCYLAPVVEEDTNAVIRSLRAKYGLGDADE